jgi:hypothetical protein
VRSENRSGPGRLRGCGGAAVLGSLGLYFGYLFFIVSGTGTSILAGTLILTFTAYLIWSYLKNHRRP